MRKFPKPISSAEGQGGACLAPTPGKRFLPCWRALSNDQRAWPLLTSLMGTGDLTSEPQGAGPGKVQDEDTGGAFPGGGVSPNLRPISLSKKMGLSAYLYYLACPKTLRALLLQ